MALPLDLNNLDLYSAVFQFLHVTNLSGDPVWDAVTKLLLPMVVLYMFVATVIGSSRFAGFGVKVIMMFITAFIIIYRGYFAIFADLSIYLLGIIIIWHTLGFVFGGGKSDSGESSKGKTKLSFGSQQVGGGSGPGLASKITHPFSRAISRNFTNKLNYSTWSTNDVKEETMRLVIRWAKEEQLVGAGKSVFGSVNNDAKAALANQDEIEEELANMVRGVGGRVKILDLISDKRLRQNVESRISAS